MNRKILDTLGRPQGGRIIFEEKSGELWSTSWGGLRKIFPPFIKVTPNSVTPSKIIHYKQEPENPHSLNTSGVDNFF